MHYTDAKEKCSNTNDKDCLSKAVPAGASKAYAAHGEQFCKDVKALGQLMKEAENGR